MADLSVIIVSYNTRDVLSRCLSALSSSIAAADVEVIVVDNGSTDGTLDLLSNSHPAVRVVANGTNVGFAAANNQGIALSTGDVVLLLNSDAFMNSRALNRCLDVLRRNPAVGLVGLDLLNEDGTFQAGHGAFPTLWDDVSRSIGLDQLAKPSRSSKSDPGPVDWVQGACMFVRRVAIQDTGGLDSRFFMYSEEVDWCWRFWQHGWHVWHAPDVSIVHLGGGSSLGNDDGRRVALYRSRLILRRQLSGRAAAAALWMAMVMGLTARVIVRWSYKIIARSDIGRHSPGADASLLQAVIRMDPLARPMAS